MTSSPESGRDVARVRNLGLVAHINAGKTTLSEAILHVSGRQPWLGAVEAGTATMDWMPEEQERGISIAAAVTTVPWRGHVIDLVDTPGHVDFTAEVQRSLRVLDGVVVILDGVRGVESQTVLVWRQADQRRLPRLVFVNKMDRATADFRAAVAAVEAKLHVKAVPLVLPVRREGALIGLHEVIRGHTEWFDRPDPEALAQLHPEAARLRVVELCADHDEEVLAAFVQGSPVSSQSLLASLRRTCLAGGLVPVLAGAALHERGVAQVLDAVCTLLPSPADLGPLSSLDPAPGGGEERRLGRSHEPFVGLAFKVQAAGAGTAVLLRVYAGKLGEGSAVRSSRGAQVPVRRLFRPHGGDREPVRELTAGDIGGFETEAEVVTGDTLHAPEHPFRLEPTGFPDPVLTRRLEPMASDRAGILAACVHELVREDPTLRVGRDPESGALLVSGMGELHLEVIADRIERRLGERVRWGTPRVHSSLTVREAAEVRLEHRASVSGESIVATVAVRVAPDPAEDHGPAMVGEVRSDDAGLVLAARHELEALLAQGVRDPSPLRGARVDVPVLETTRGSAGAALALEALRDALARAIDLAGRVVLEPRMGLVVSCPAESVSAVLADLGGREAEIRGVEVRGEDAEIEARARLARLLGYAIRLRSITRGLGSVVLTPLDLVSVDLSETPAASQENAGPGLDPGQRDR